MLKINPYLFEKQFDAFKAFVEEKCAVPFTSFSSNPYVYEQEGYKNEIHRVGRERLAFQAWKKTDIGSEQIISAVIDAIEIKDNNLVQWQAKYGEEARQHHVLYQAKGNKQKTREIETLIYDFFINGVSSSSFDQFIGVFGKKYALIAYLFFLKDKSRYLPIAPTYFDRAFECLGADLTTSKKCSKENYESFIHLLSQTKQLLSEKLGCEVTLLDAHSFAWIIAAQMYSENKIANIDDYLQLSDTERDAVVKARIGQGLFRQYLLDYWGECAITGCKNTTLLRASHIKPWSKSNVAERLSLYNGILLSPTLDVCFDSGLISFTNDGEIIISSQLSNEDQLFVGINNNMKLKNISYSHLPFLEYHREHVLLK